VHGGPWPAYAASLLLTSGDEYDWTRRLHTSDPELPATAVRQALARFVEQVLDRLTEAGVSGTPLQREPPR